MAAISNSRKRAVKSSSGMDANHSDLLMQHMRSRVAARAQHASSSRIHHKEQGALACDCACAGLQVTRQADITNFGNSERFVQQHVAAAAAAAGAGPGSQARVHSVIWLSFPPPAE